MRTLLIRYSDAPKGMRRWRPFLETQLVKAGFDLDRAVMTEIARNRKSVVYYQEDHATMDDIMNRISRIEKLLNIPEDQP